MRKRHDPRVALDAEPEGGWPTCSPVEVPEEYRVKAAQVAVSVNPANAPNPVGLASLFAGLIAAPDVPGAIAVLTTKYWGAAVDGKLTVKFLDTSHRAFKEKVLTYANSWFGGRRRVFVETRGNAVIRVATTPGEGYYSYLGTDCKLIPANRKTMNLASFSLSTPEAEWRRVVPHEFGHALGFPHEHMRKELIERLDPAKTVEYMRGTYGWPEWMTKQQVLTPLDDRSIYGTPADQDSVMCYQLPGQCTRDGRPVTGGASLNATDRQFCVAIYPR